MQLQRKQLVACSTRERDRVCTRATTVGRNSDTDVCCGLMDNSTQAAHARRSSPPRAPFFVVRLPFRFLLLLSLGLLLRGEEVEAEAALERALKIARTQKARSFELRASRSLAQQWQKQGKHTEAHQLLSLIYSWFTEGFDTADLRDTRVLLDAFER